MKFHVPQFIDIEDKIAFRLTAKQLGWLGFGGVIMFVLWHYLVIDAFLIWAVVIGLISIAFAFYKPHGLFLVEFLIYAFTFYISPRRIIWKQGSSGRAADKEIQKIKKKPNREGEEASLSAKSKEKALKDLQQYAKILDMGEKQ